MGYFVLFLSDSKQAGGFKGGSTFMGVDDGLEEAMLVYCVLITRHVLYPICFTYIFISL